MVRVGAPVRSARAVPAAAAVRRAVRGAAVLRRGRGDRRGARAAARRRCAPRRGRRWSIVTGDHGEGARRSRRADARPLRLRVDAAGSADHRGDRRSAMAQAEQVRRAGRVEPDGRRGSVVRRGAARRHPADDPRRGGAAGARRICRDARCCRRPSGAPARRRGPSYFEAMGAMLNRGWAPLTGVLADRDKLIDLPIAERYDLAADPAERVEPVGPRAGARSRARGEPARLQRGAARRAPRGGRRRRRAAARARLRVGQRAGEGALHRGRRSEAARRSRSGGPRRRRGVRRAPVRRRGADLPGRHRAPARHGDRLSPSGVRRVAARQPGRRRRRRCSARSRPA